jgi:hypothetical protein
MCSQVLVRKKREIMYTVDYDLFPLTFEAMPGSWTNSSSLSSSGNTGFFRGRGITSCLSFGRKATFFSSARGTGMTGAIAGRRPFC